MSMHLVLSTRVICNEIAIGLPQKVIAKTYALAMLSEAAGADKPDWREINNAIIKRWSRVGLERVKTMAHKQLGAA